MLTIALISIVENLKEADNLIVLSTDGRMESQGLFEELAKKNQYIQSLSCSPSPEDTGVEEESKGSDSQVGEIQEVKKEIGETTQRKTVSEISRGDGDISLYTYYINSFGWWAFGLTLVFAILYVFCIAFPREYSHRWTYSETLLLNNIAEVMLSWWCDSVPSKNYIYLGSYVGISFIAIIAMGVFIGYVLKTTILYICGNISSILGSFLSGLFPGRRLSCIRSSWTR